MIGWLIAESLAAHESVVRCRPGFIRGESLPAFGMRQKNLWVRPQEEPTIAQFAGSYGAAVDVAWQPAITHVASMDIRVK